MMFLWILKLRIKMQIEKTIEWVKTGKTKVRNGKRLARYLV